MSIQKRCTINDCHVIDDLIEESLWELLIERHLEQMRPMVVIRLLILLRAIMPSHTIVTIAESTSSRLAGIGRGSRPRMWWAGEESIKKLTRNLYGSVRLQSKHCFTSSKPNRVYLEFSCEQSSISFELISGWTKCRIVGDIVLAAMEWKVAFEGILAMWRYTHQAHQAYYN